MKHIYFVRHAESVASVDGFEAGGGKNDVLTELGKKQASEFARNYTGNPLLIVSSSYSRARETAQPLIDIFPKAKFEEWDHIHEFLYLKKCTNIEEKNKLRKDYWSKQDPKFRDGENTESFSELVSRVDKALEKIVKAKESSIVIFSHAKFMRMIILRLINSKNVDHSDLMKMLISYSFRFGYCDTLEIYSDEKDTLYLKDMRKIKLR